MPSGPLNNIKIAALVAEEFEDNELWYPVYFLRSLGCTVEIVGQEAGATVTGKHGVPIETELAYTDLDASQYDGVLIPGGHAPDKIRRSDEVKQFVKQVHASGKLVATICHGPWVAASAGILKGQTVTSWPSVKDDLINAGADWVDQETVVCANLITARCPDDLPAFGNAIKDWLQSQHG